MTMLLLGIVEPWIGIRWTQYNEKQKQAAEAASKAAQSRQKPVASPFVQVNAAVKQSFGGYNYRYAQPMPFGYGASNTHLAYGAPFSPTYGVSYGAQWSAMQTVPPPPRYWG
jgi:hypothetical protein